MNAEQILTKIDQYSEEFYRERFVDRRTIGNALETIKCAMIQGALIYAELDRDERRDYVAELKARQ